MLCMCTVCFLSILSDTYNLKLAVRVRERCKMQKWAGLVSMVINQHGRRKDSGGQFGDRVRHLQRFPGLADNAAGPVLSRGI